MEKKCWATTYFMRKIADWEILAQSGRVFSVPVFNVAEVRNDVQIEAEDLANFWSTEQLLFALVV